MLGDGHVRFGGRAEETDQPKGWHRASVRPNNHRRPHSAPADLPPAAFETPYDPNQTLA